MEKTEACMENRIQIGRMASQGIGLYAPKLRTEDVEVVNSFTEMQRLPTSEKSVILMKDKALRLFERKGALECFVEETSVLRDNAIGGNSVVLAEESAMSDDSMAIGNVILDGSARLGGKTIVFGNNPEEPLIIKDNVELIGNLHIYGFGTITGSIKIKEVDGEVKTDGHGVIPLHIKIKALPNPSPRN